MGNLTLAATGDITIASVYLPVGGTLNEGAQASTFLTRVMDMIRDAGKPYIIGGDFNRAPGATAQWLAQQGCRAKVANTGAPTYHSKQGSTEIDYYILSDDLLPHLHDVEQVHKEDTPEHNPVQATLSKAHADQLVRVLKKKKATPDAAIGPRLGHEADGLWHNISRLRIVPSNFATLL